MEPIGSGGTGPSVSEKNGKGRRHGTRVPLMVLLLGSAAVGGALFLAYKGGRLVTDDAYVHATVYNIQPRIPGTVLEVAVADNQPVSDGQLLVSLDPEEPRILVRLAEAALAGARMQHEEALVAVRAAEAEVRLAEAEREQAEKDLKRFEALWKKRTVSEDQYDRTATRLRVLSSRAAAAGAGAALAATRVETSRTAVETAAAKLADARLTLGYTEIRSPGEGIVSKKNVEAGMVVQPGQPLMAVVDLEDSWVEANFKETQLRRIRPGLKAHVRADFNRRFAFEGRVESIEAGAGSAFSLFPPENATGNWVKVVQRVPVKIMLEHGPAGEGAPALRVGMSVEVTVFPEEKPFLTRLLSFLPGF